MLDALGRRERVVIPVAAGQEIGRLGTRTNCSRQIREARDESLVCPAHPPDPGGPVVVVSGLEFDVPEHPEPPPNGPGVRLRETHQAPAEPVVARCLRSVPRSMQLAQAP